MFCGTYQQALNTAKANAARTGEYRYIFAYINDWHCERAPSGDTSERIDQYGNVVKIQRNNNGVWLEIMEGDENA